MNLFDFADTEIEDTKKEPLTDNNNRNQRISENNNREDLEKTIDKYSSMNQSDLQDELFKEVDKMKESGSFDYSKFVEMSKSLEPYLTKEQQNNLSVLLNKIR